METNIKEINLEYGYSLKTYNLAEENKNYYVVEIYKDNNLQFFDEVKI